MFGTSKCFEIPDERCCINAPFFTQKEYSLLGLSQTTHCTTGNHVNERKVPLLLLTARSCLASYLIKHVSVNVFSVSVFTKDVGH